MADKKGSTCVKKDIHALEKEWDEASCPICMDHPHNAVLLICSSHEKGCRSYICDTSYRHSNCLDRFKKLRVDDTDSLPEPDTSSLENFITERLRPMHPHSRPSAPFMAGPRMGRSPVGNHEGISEGLEADNNNSEGAGYAEARTEERISLEESGSRNTLATECLKCPLCRGTVMGWMIVQEAREYLDLKPRSCSRESCSFIGNYRELRKHARRAHPTTRPGDVDPSRQQAWRHLEHQREYGDILSAIRSAMPGAVVLGDYVIDDGDGLLHDPELGDVTAGPWWATLFLFHMMSSPTRLRNEPRSSSRTWRTHRRQRYLWGENLLGLQDDDDDDDFLRPSRRRRLTRSRSDEDQP